jgi:hypothetical protein
MAPPRRGFNLAAYFVPGALIAVAAGALLWTVKRRARVPAVVASRAPGGSVSASDSARLDEALADLER